MAQDKYLEDQVYDFKYLKIVKNEEEAFHAFEDSYGDKYILPVEYYKHYIFEAGQQVRCMVVRVDCNGKLSFEPEHPYYKIGGVYDFRFVKMTITSEMEYNPSIGKSIKTKEYELIVEDRYGDLHSVKTSRGFKNKYSQSDNVKCRVKKIVKGNFYLENTDTEKNIFRKILNLLRLG
ncbi:MAG: hypothetical protein U0W24_14630 [Bacteroidales bacterium]